MRFRPPTVTGCGPPVRPPFPVLHALRGAVFLVPVVPLLGRRVFLYALSLFPPFCSLFARVRRDALPALLRAWIRPAPLAAPLAPLSPFLLRVVPRIAACSHFLRFFVPLLVLALPVRLVAAPTLCSWRTPLWSCAGLVRCCYARCSVCAFAASALPAALFCPCTFRLLGSVLFSSLFCCPVLRLRLSFVLRSVAVLLAPVLTCPLLLICGLRPSCCAGFSC